MGTRLSQHKTSMLKHFSQYQSMQDNLITSIIEINSNIIEINRAHNAFTPKLADSIIQKPRNKKHRIHYSRLVDGVHPVQSVREDWASKLIHAIKINRSSNRPIRPSPSLVPGPPSSD